MMEGWGKGERRNWNGRGNGKERIKKCRRGYPVAAAAAALSGVQHAPAASAQRESATRPATGAPLPVHAAGLQSGWPRLAEGLGEVDWAAAPGPCG